MTIALWGLAFKPGTDDMREAPSQVVVRELARRGAKIRAYDPVATARGAARPRRRRRASSSSRAPCDALRGADALVIVTEWKEFRSVDLDAMRALMRGHVHRRRPQHPRPGGRRAPPASTTPASAGRGRHSSLDQLPMILVTGGAGFIGSNFVLDWLALGDEPVLNLDALTYAGNTENLASLAGDARHVFVRGDICDRRAARPPVRRAPAARRRPLRGREPRRPQHPRPGRFHAHQRAGHLHAARGGARALVEARRRRASAAFRFLHVSTDEVYGSLAQDDPAFCEIRHLRAEQPLFGEQGGERPPRARLAPHLRAAGR